MIKKTIQITSKGQITVPKKIRDAFKTDTITINLINDNEALITPLKTAEGSLSKYAKQTSKPYEEIRQDAWEKETKNRK